MPPSERKKGGEEKRDKKLTSKYLPFCLFLATSGSTQSLFLALSSGLLLLGFRGPYQRPHGQEACLAFTISSSHSKWFPKYLQGKPNLLLTKVKQKIWVGLKQSKCLSFCTVFLTPGVPFCFIEGVGIGLGIIAGVDTQVTSGSTLYYPGSLSAFFPPTPKLIYRL